MFTLYVSERQIFQSPATTVGQVESERGISVFIVLLNTITGWNFNGVYVSSTYLQLPFRVWGTFDPSICNMKTCQDVIRNGLPL
jgi:hypothetical protein